MKIASNRRTHRVCTLLAVSLIVVACHSAPGPPYAATPEECRAAQQSESSRIIHIDGPRKDMPRIGDTLVLIVNEREAWRGVYDPCRPSASRYAAALDHVIPPTDSVISFEVERGANVAAKYHVGWSRVTAFIIRTAPPPE